MNTAKGTTTISKSEVNKLIKEEVDRLLAIRRLKQINESLSKMEGKGMMEDDCMEEKKDMVKEVEAGAMEKLEPGQSFGGGKGEKFTPKFEKKGSHLLEDEEGQGFFEKKFAEVGKEIDAKMGSSEDMSADADTNKGDDFSEIEISDTDDDNKVGDDTETVVTDDEKDTVEEVVNENGENTKKGLEKIPGHSVAQDAHKDPANPNYEKATAVDEAKKPTDKAPLQEGKQVSTTEAKNVLIESMDSDKRKTVLSEQLIRMNNLAGIK